MKEFTAGHISTDEASVIDSLGQKIGIKNSFYTGVQYRHPDHNGRLWTGQAAPPHDILDKEIGHTTRRITERILELMSAPGNLADVLSTGSGSSRKPPATVWLWGQGTERQLLFERCGLTGG